jgi:hypothetical protein
MPAHPGAQDAETILDVVVGDALDEAGQHFLNRWLRLRLHIDGVRARRGFEAIASCLDASILSITSGADHLALDRVVQRAPSFSQLRRERWSKLLLQTPHQRFTKRDEMRRGSSELCMLVCQMGYD